MIRKTIIVLLTLAAVGTGALWVTSYRRPVYVMWDSTFPDPVGAISVQASFRQGRVALELVRSMEAAVPADMSLSLGGRVDDLPRNSAERSFRLAPVLQCNFTTWDLPFLEAGRVTRYHHLQKAQLWCDCWFPFILFGAYPTIAFVRGPLRRYRMRRREARRGLCTTCGYNLTGNVSGVCPECGTPFDPEILDSAPPPDSGSSRKNVRRDEDHAQKEPHTQVCAHSEDQTPPARTKSRKFVVPVVIIVSLIGSILLGMRLFTGLAQGEFPNGVTLFGDHCVTFNRSRLGWLQVDFLARTVPFDKPGMLVLNLEDQDLVIASVTPDTMRALDAWQNSSHPEEWAHIVRREDETGNCFLQFTFSRE